jgi:hypothetical protein
MYNSLIFINFISRSKKVKPKIKSCRKHLFTVNKLLRLWYFVSVLNLKFLDQLERRHCKDIPFFRPFYIGAPKGPFLWGLRRRFFSIHRKKSFSIFPSPAGMSLTKLSLGGNNDVIYKLFPPRECSGWGREYQKAFLRCMVCYEMYFLCFYLTSWQTWSLAQSALVLHVSPLGGRHTAPNSWLPSWHWHRNLPSFLNNGPYE